MMVNFNDTHLFIGLIALVIALVVLRMQKKSFSYLFFFSVFWIYMLGVISVVVFPFPIDLSNPNFKLSVNLIPFNFGSCFKYLPEVCFRTLYENILLTIPFGFGISFIARVKPGSIVWFAVAVGLVLELSQLAISLIFRTSFRSVDINDVVLNALGVLLGYGTFRIFGWLYSSLIQKLQLQPRDIFAYISDIVHQQN
jgi:glycopeptide antibiotics resistance protein